MGFTSSLADPDVWFRADCKPDGFEYYSYILVYVDDILVISHQPVTIMSIIAKSFRLKDGYAHPTRYLGATIRKWKLPGDEDAMHWGHSAEEYVRQAILNVEAELLKEGNNYKDVIVPP